MGARAGRGAPGARDALLPRAAGAVGARVDQVLAGARRARLLGRRGLGEVVLRVGGRAPGALLPAREGAARPASMRAALGAARRLGAAQEWPALGTAEEEEGGGGGGGGGGAAALVRAETLGRALLARLLFALRAQAALDAALWSLPAASPGRVRAARARDAAPGPEAGLRLSGAEGARSVQGGRDSAAAERQVHVSGGQDGMGAVPARQDGVGGLELELALRVLGPAAAVVEAALCAEANPPSAPAAPPPLPPLRPCRAPALPLPRQQSLPPPPTPPAPPKARGSHLRSTRRITLHRPPYCSLSQPLSRARVVADRPVRGVAVAG